MALWDEAGLGPGMESVGVSVGRCSGSCWAIAQVGEHPGVGLYPGVVCMPKGMLGSYKVFQAWVVHTE